jgi:NAD(P)-dependent dehydrogenase (short-subunit alcohol dehydrogenase family)
MNTDGSLKGKTIAITGSTSGIGLATALGLAGRGAHIIGVGRSEAKCSQAMDIIKTSYPEAHLTYYTADLSSRKQIGELAENIRGGLHKEGRVSIDALINTAGTFTSWYVSTEEGFELQFAVNYMAPFLLTHELLDLLKASPNGRIITVSSGSHYNTRMHWKDVMLRKHYNCLLAYKQSKLADVLFTFEFNRRYGRNCAVRAYAADPGLVNTEIGLKRTTGIANLVWKYRRKSGTSPAAGAATSLYLASEPSLPDGNAVYWKECKPKKPSKYSMNEDAAQRLWDMTERMCGIS